MQPSARQRARDRGGREPSEGWREKFLAALHRSYLPSEAAKVAGVSRAYAYKIKKNDPEFDEAWQDAIEKQTEILEQMAVKRAADGSDTLLMFLLKARRPGVYRENVHHDHQHQVDGQIRLELPDGQQPVDIPAVNRREAARLLLASSEVIEGQETISGEAA